MGLSWEKVFSSHAPIRVQQHFNQNLVSLWIVKSDRTTHYVIFVIFSVEFFFSDEDIKRTLIFDVPNLVCERQQYISVYIRSSVSPISFVEIRFQGLFSSGELTF